MIRDSICWNGLPGTIYSIRRQILSRLVVTVWLGMFLTIFSASSSAQQENVQHAGQSDKQLLLQFSQQSASQLVDRYFQGPPYPLFVIRRLIDLADHAATPGLRTAFSQETQPVTRQALAAALVRLRDPDSQYFDYLDGKARDAVSSDLPYLCGLTGGTTPDAKTEFPLDFIAWARAHDMTLSDALRTAAIELPAAVEALGEAADHRALAILLRGLSSPNSCIVQTSAFGLARLHDTDAVEPIIRACNTLRREDRLPTAKSLLYFDSGRAQQAADSLIADPVLVRSWRIEVKRRGWKSAMRDRAIP